jgi:hypothetical protein
VRRVLGFLFVIAGASSAVAVGNTTSPPSDRPSSKPAQVVAAPKVKLAPADEYFGPMKMSVLGIRNEIHDLMIKYEPTYDYDHHLAKATMGVAVMTEASLRDWEVKYPLDGQLARYVYLLEHLYAKIQTDDAQAKAKICAQWLMTRYGGSWYAKNLRTAMTKQTASPASASAPQDDAKDQSASSDPKPASIVPVPATSVAPQAASSPAPGSRP